MYKRMKVNLHIRKADEHKARKVNREIGFTAFVSYCLNELDLQEIVKSIKHNSKK